MSPGLTKGFIDLPANGTAQKALSHRFDGLGKVAIVEGVLSGDALAADDATAPCWWARWWSRARTRDGDGNVVAALSFAATLDSAESDLTRHTPEALALWFGEDTVRDAGGPSGSAPKVPVWTWLILLAVLAFFFEGVLLRK